MANLDQSGGKPLAMASAKATVKWFNSTKGYGFVTLENGGDAFCHASALAEVGTPNLAQGATIVCDLQESPRGLQVVAVHSVDNSTAETSGGGGGGERFGSRGGQDGGQRRGGGGGYGADRYGGGDRFGGGDHFGGGDRFGGNDRFGGDRFGGDDRFSGGDRFGGGGDRFGGGGFGGQRERDSGPSGPMMEGSVKFFNDQKGFGFVMPQNGSGDVYLHASALRRSNIPVLVAEQRIRFSTRQGNKGVEVDRIELI